MPTFEIPRENWIERLNTFTMAHEGWLVSLDVFSPAIGAQPDVVNLPLLGVSADRIERDGTIAVSVARSPVEHFTHVIHGVARVFLEQVDDGATSALLFESGDGVRTLLHLRAPASSPTLDPPMSEPIASGPPRPAP